MIKIKPGYSLRNVLDAYVIIGTGRDAYIPNCIMSLNETGAFLWEMLEHGAEKTELVTGMTDAFEVTAEDAEKDIEIFLAQLTEKGLIQYADQEI